MVGVGGGGAEGRGVGGWRWRCIVGGLVQTSSSSRLLENGKTCSCRSGLERGWCLSCSAW